MTDQTKEKVAFIAFWEPIESAPKDGSYLLTFTPTRRPPQEVMKWQTFEDARRNKWVSADQSWYVNGPTHWMPLSSPST